MSRQCFWRGRRLLCCRLVCCCSIPFDTFFDTFFDISFVFFGCTTTTTGGAFATTIRGKQARYDVTAAGFVTHIWHLKNNEVERMCQICHHAIFKVLVCLYFRPIYSGESSADQTRRVVHACSVCRVLVFLNNQPGSHMRWGSFFVLFFLLPHLPSAVRAMIFSWREGFRRPFPSSTMKSNRVYSRSFLRVFDCSVCHSTKTITITTADFGKKRTNCFEVLMRTDLCMCRYEKTT